MGKIATQAEWQAAKEILAARKRQGTFLHSGFKISTKEHQSLAHSFLYLRGEYNNQKLVCLAKHHHLGFGTFGKVKLAEDEVGNLYALKTLTEYLNEDEKTALTMLGCLFCEGKRIATGVRQKQEFFFLEKLAEGITLEEYLLLCVLTQEQKQCVAYHVAEAIHKVHQKKLIHNDIRPANIMISISERGAPIITLVDFGGAKKIPKGKSKYIGFNIGARKYSAPEADQNPKSELSIKSDVYSLGIVLKNDMGLKDEFVSRMCLESSEKRPNLVKVLEELVSSKAVKLPVPDLKNRLINKYKIVVENIKTGIRDKIKNCNVSYEDNNENGLLLDTTYIVDDDYEQTDASLAQLMEVLVQKRRVSNQKVEFSLKEVKRELLASIQRIVRLTDNIEELYEFFNQLRVDEYRAPVLRRERCCLMGVSGMTSSWGAVLGIFKVRAMEIAREKVNTSATKDLQNVDLFRDIFSESRARIPKVRPTREVEFEVLVRLNF